MLMVTRNTAPPQQHQRETGSEQADARRFGHAPGLRNEAGKRMRIVETRGRCQRVVGDRLSGIDVNDAGDPAPRERVRVIGYGDRADPLDD